MSEDKQHEIYQKGFRSGRKHSEPAPLTKEFMAKMDQEIKYIKEKLDKMPTREEMLLTNEKLVERIFKKANQKYASKLTEKVVYGMIGVMLLYILNQFLSLL